MSKFESRECQDSDHSPKKYITWLVSKPSMQDVTRVYEKLISGEHPEGDQEDEIAYVFWKMQDEVESLDDIMQTIKHAKAVEKYGSDPQKRIIELFKKLYEIPIQDQNEKLEKLTESTENEEDVINVLREINLLAMVREFTSREVMILNTQVTQNWRGGYTL